MLDAIVSAWNEGETIGNVVRELHDSGVFRVTVVDDGSTDDTVAQAISAGARVIQHPTNQGKAAAMRTGLRATTSDPVGFFDADLRGFYSRHAVRFYRLAGTGYDMVCGLREGARLPGLLGPLITGERVVRRWVMRDVPETCMSGYLIETGMNHAASRGRTCVFHMDGVTIKHSLEKFGLLGSLQKEWKMFRGIARASDALLECGSCDPNQCRR